MLDDCATVGFRTSGLVQTMFSGVDILVVVDNSMSMAEEQANLAANFPLLIQSLLNPPDSDGDTLPDHEPLRDLHIGVVSTDMGTGGYSVETCSDPIDGDNGELQHSPNPSVSGCEAAYPTYLSYAGEEPDITEIDRLATGFGCIATLGIDGCGFEQQLKAAAKALIDHRDGVNAGFLRPDSILFVLFMTDEEDCSVAPGNEGIFDTLDSSLGHLNLRCFHHPYMVEPVDTYITAFQSLRADPSKLMLGFIVGVPQGEQCEGFGDSIPTCLDHPDMMEQVDPVSMTRLVPSCVTSTGDAYPPRRFVQVAQLFGRNSLVSSICTDDFGPAVTGMTGALQEKLDGDSIATELSTRVDPADPCRCMASCVVVEALTDMRSCDTVGKPCWEPNGPGTGCADPEVDPDGMMHSLCEIPQAGTRMSPCESGLTGCDDVGITHAIDGAGWYYMGQNWTESPGDVFHAVPEILFTSGMEPAEGSNVYISCQDCYGGATGASGESGFVGTSCTPVVCPEGPYGCDWDPSYVYFAESFDCSGGACMVFRDDPYCSRRCGPGELVSGCPSGFECFAPEVFSMEDLGCWCVDQDLLNLSPGHPDTRGVDACR
jgi:hypothetical protein